MNVLAALALWYFISGGVVVAACLAPGALVGTDDNLPKRLSLAVWAVVWLTWPYFYGRWWINTLRQP